jgi:hypothetical protein
VAGTGQQILEAERQGQHRGGEQQGRGARQFDLREPGAGAQQAPEVGTRVVVHGVTDYAGYVVKVWCRDLDNNGRKPHSRAA